MKKITFVTLLSFSSLPIYATAANCKFYPNHHQNTFNVTVPETLSIPRDTPIGTVIYESPPVTLNNINSSYYCGAADKSGVYNNVGAANFNLTTLPIGNTGLGWRWGESGKNLFTYPSGDVSPGGYGFNESTFYLTIVKIGDTAERQGVPAGVLGWLRFGELSTIGMSTSGMTITPQSCETPDIKVDMGETDISTFSHNGASSNPVNFAINLNNCPSGINKITYSLQPTPTSPAQNSIRGIVKLSADSTATGLALQILDSNGNDFVLHQNYTLSDYSTAGGNFSIPLKARYFRVIATGSNGGFDKGMRAGTANASITFIMNYL